MNTHIINTTTNQLDTQAIRELELPRPAVLGIASGIFFMAFSGIGGIFLKYALSLPKKLSQEDEAESKRIWMWFGIIFGIEFVTIAISSILLSTFQLDVFIAPAIALIVGIHFFPLAVLFRVSVYYITGGLIAGLALNLAHKLSRRETEYGQDNARRI